MREITKLTALDLPSGLVASGYRFRSIVAKAADSVYYTLV